MLWAIVLYALAIYGVVSLWLQVMKYASWWYVKNKEKIHLLILLHDSEEQVEWLYRSLHKMSRTTGRPLSFTFIDCGSKDDTLLILERLARNSDHISIRNSSELSGW